MPRLEIRVPPQLVAGNRVVRHVRDLLVEIDLTALGETVKWEKSRGGALFPHVYGEIPASAVRGLRHVRRNEEGDWVLPADLESRS